MFGMMAMAGIVINDYYWSGLETHEAVIKAAKSRFKAIF